MTNSEFCVEYNLVSYNKSTLGDVTVKKLNLHF
jgi:hypothetical protein